MTECVKGWRPNVGAATADVGQSGIGKSPVFWMLDLVGVPVLPESDRSNVSDECEVDATNFVFKQSEGAVMSQKAHRRIASQRRVEVMWAGPAVVREKRTERRVPSGRRGPGMRKPGAVCRQWWGWQ